MTFTFIRRGVLPGAWRPSRCRVSPVTWRVTSCSSPGVTARCSEVTTATWSTWTWPGTPMARWAAPCLCRRPPPSWGHGRAGTWPRVTASAATRTPAAPWPPTPSVPPTAPASTSPTSPTTAASGPYSAEKWCGDDRILFLKCDNFSNTGYRWYFLELTTLIRFV